MVLYGLLIGFCVRMMLYLLRFKSVVAGVAVWAVVLVGAQGGYATSVLQTWWIWAYDLPKHLVVLGVVLLYVCRLRFIGLRSYARARGGS